jgi:hypothetical protein
VTMGSEAESRGEGHSRCDIVRPVVKCRVRELATEL